MLDDAKIRGPEKVTRYLESNSQDKGEAQETFRGNTTGEFLGYGYEKYLQEDE